MPEKFTLSSIHHLDKAKRKKTGDKGVKKEKKENPIASMIGDVAKSAAQRYLEEKGTGMSLHNTALNVMNSHPYFADSPLKSKFLRSAVTIAARICRENGMDFLEITDKGEVIDHRLKQTVTPQLSGEDNLDLTVMKRDAIVRREEAIQRFGEDKARENGY